MNALKSVIKTPELYRMVGSFRWPFVIANLGYLLLIAVAIADVVVVIVAAIGVFAAVAFVVDPVFTAIIHIWAEAFEPLLSI